MEGGVFFFFFDTDFATFNTYKEGALVEGKEGLVEGEAYTDYWTGVEVGDRAQNKDWASLRLCNNLMKLINIIHPKTFLSLITYHQDTELHQRSQYSIACSKSPLNCSLSSPAS